MRGTILFSLPGARAVDPSDACLLGTPIGNLDSVTAALRAKINSLERLSHMSAQDALIVLHNAFSTPKLLFILRTSPSFLSPALDSYDESLKSIVSRITNNHFEANDPAWSQATLPVGVFGLGIRSTVQLALSAFLASAAATRNLVQEILPLRLQHLPTPNMVDALSSWSSGHGNPPPSGTAACVQKTWDAYKISSSMDSLLQNAPHDLAHARLLAVSAKESGAWLNALLSSSLGLGWMMTPSGLQLGSA